MFSMKTKILTLKLKIPSRYKYLAIQPYGDIVLFTSKPKITKDTGNYEYWKIQESEACLTKDNLSCYNFSKNWKKSVRKI